MLVEDLCRLGILVIERVDRLLLRAFRYAVGLPRLECDPGSVYYRGFGVTHCTIELYTRTMKQQYLL